MPNEVMPNETRPNETELSRRGLFTKLGILLNGVVATALAVPPASNVRMPDRPVCSSLPSQIAP